MLARIIQSPPAQFYASSNTASQRTAWGNKDKLISLIILTSENEALKRVTWLNPERTLRRRAGMDALLQSDEAEPSEILPRRGKMSDPRRAGRENY